MGTVETLAAKLADDTMAAMKEVGDERLYIEVGDVLGASSQTLEEAYLTEVRVRLAAVGAQRFLARRLSEARAKKAGTPAAPPPNPPPTAD